MSEVIECVGRRRLKISKEDGSDNVCMEILIRNNRIATLVLEPKQVEKLINELQRDMG